MSLFEKYLAGWQFRTTRPRLTVGDTVDVFLSEYDETAGVGRARVGDTELRVEGAEPGHEGSRVRVEVTAFDEAEAAGRGEFRGVVGESAYSG